jgi:hypothetical protein
MNALPTTCKDFVSHPHIVNGRGCYTCQEALASEEQGTSQIAQGLQDLGINASVWQSGGFTMCVYLNTGGDSYLLANDEGFSFYKDEDCEGWAHYSFKESENTSEKKAEAIRQTLAVVFTK